MYLNSWLKFRSVHGGSLHIVTFAAKFAAGFFGVLALEAFCITCYFSSICVKMDDVAFHWEISHLQVRKGME